MSRDELSKLKRNEVTTLSIPKALKERIDEVKPRDQTYAEFLADLVQPEVTDSLEELRRESETFGDVIQLLTAPADHDLDERKALIESALDRSDVVDQSTTEVHFDNG